MKYTTAFICSMLICLAGTSAQVTIVKGAPNQIFDLSCTKCTMTVEDVSLWPGVRVLPYHKTNSGLVNLLYWKYYDSIMKEEVTTSSELSWEKCTQLIDAIGDGDTVSLQINLVWTDSMEQKQKIYLLLGGLLKSDLASLPLDMEYDAEALTLKHFASIVQIKYEDGKTETYESVSGEMSLTRFDPRTVAIAGSFEFEGNCIGWVKRGTFLNGVFEKE
ncbi:MAG: hypothetical protein KDC61_02110 [Saprospiraceae bacterium]|nr:hypothetical protein [Saprospiraceae bacterium]MCB0573344.1 hypothetical protein [Saprospiraceae bacterium]MCB9306079.1 hypothetical protein [Lewinellaceae bacterium]MCB9356229.1 hypothetical protein [Lewinellaceae bacterium]